MKRIWGCCLSVLVLLGEGKVLVGGIVPLPLCQKEEGTSLEASAKSAIRYYQRCEERIDRMRIGFGIM
jgi:hypothetical protein